MHRNEATGIMQTFDLTRQHFMLLMFIMYPILLQAECERRLLVLCVKNIGDINEFLFLLSQPGVDPNIYDKVGQYCIVILILS